MKKLHLILGALAICSQSAMFAQKSVPVTLGMRVATQRYAEVSLPQGNLLPVWTSDKCGFLSLDGELILSPTYDKDKSNSKYPVNYEFRDGMMRVVKNGKYGFIDGSAKEVIACQYEDAQDFSDGMAAVKVNGVWGYVDKQGKMVVEPSFKFAYPFSSQMAAVVDEKDSVGFIDPFGLLVIPYYYDRLDEIAFVDSLCSVRKIGTAFSINKKGERFDVVTKVERKTSIERSQLDKLRSLEIYNQAPTPFDELLSFQNGFAVVMQKNKNGKKQYGVLNTKGLMVVPCEYDQIEGPFTSAVTYFVVERGGKIGAVKTDGTPLLACEYDKVFSEGSEMIMVQKDGLKGFADKNGTLKIPCQYEDLAPFNSSVTGVAIRKKDKLVWNFMNQKGEIVSTPEYDEILTFCNGVCPVKKKGKWGFVNEEMKPISSFKYDYSFSDVREKWSYRWSKSNLIPVSKEGKFGFIDRLGKEIILCQYEDALAFATNGLARVQKDGKYGFVNEKGEQVIPCQYEKASTFRKGFAIVTRGGVKYILDAKGMEKPSRNISEDSEAVCASQVVEKNGLYGLLDEKGAILTSCIFDHIGDFENGYAPLKIVNRWGVIDCQGNIVVPCLYDDLKYNGDGMFSVKVAGKRGVVDASGKSIIGGETRQVKWIPLGKDSVTVE